MLEMMEATGYSDWALCWHSSLSPDERRDSTFKNHDRLVPKPDVSAFIPHDYSCLKKTNCYMGADGRIDCNRRSTGMRNKSVVKQSKN